MTVMGRVGAVLFLAGTLLPFALWQLQVVGLLVGVVLLGVLCGAGYLLLGR